MSPQGRICTSARVLRLGVLVPLLGLATCNDPSLGLGTPPPVTLVEQRVVVPLHGGVERRALGEAVASLGGARSGSPIRAAVGVGQPGRAEAVRRALVGLGLDSALVTTADEGGDAVVLSRTRAQVNDCSLALATTPDGGVSRSITSLGSCIQANALASMLADPADLVAPPRLQPASGARAAQAVLRWQRAGAPAGSDAATGGGGGEEGASGGQAAGQAGGASAAGGLAGDTAGAAGSSLPAAPPAAGAAAAGARAE